MSPARRLSVAVLICLSGSTTAAAQTPVSTPQAQVHVLKITAGPAGKEADGTFLLTEERTVFGRADDREVIVLFEWDGVPGPHKLVAQWRSPDGGLGSTSAIDYIAKGRRFGGYWRLPISPAMPLGTWSIETTVDGQPAGRLTFEIKGISLVPLSLVRINPDAPPEQLSALFLRGDLVRPLFGEEHVVSGGFAKTITRSQTVQPSDQREQFSREDKTFVTYVTWHPLERLRGQAVLRVSDAENRTVIESKPGKLDVRKDQHTLSSWTLPVPPAAGVYRVDTLIDGKPIWRGFVRISQ